MKFKEEEMRNDYAENGPPEWAKKIDAEAEQRSQEEEIKEALKLQNKMSKFVTDRLL